MSQVTLIWSKVQGSRLTVILPRIMSYLFVILSNISMNKEIGKFFFAFARESKSFAIVCAVVFLFVLLLSVFERPIVSCTFDWLLLYAQVAVSSDTPERK